jgi:hypothetical protein
MISGIEECFKMKGIDNYDQIDVDVISLDGTHLDNFTPPINSSSWEPSTMQYYSRFNQVSSFYNSFDDMLEFMKANPLVNYRYYFQPTEVLLPSSQMISFKPENSIKFIETAKKEAADVINLGPGVAF